MVPEKFEMFINLQTARRLGVIITQHALVQGDEATRIKSGLPPCAANRLL
jgi:hypothetical protein